VGSYVFTHQAEQDLIEIYCYSFLNHGQKQADQYAETLKTSCQTLADHPLLCRERNEFTPPVRIHHVKKHFIVYQVEADKIVIVRFLHDRMDIGLHIS